MAKQKGIVPLKGTIRNATFYKSKAGYLAREKGGIDGNRIATDPAFVRTRDNRSECVHAGKVGRLLRTSLRALLLSINDSYNHTLERTNMRAFRLPQQYLTRSA